MQLINNLNPETLRKILLFLSTQRGVPVTSLNANLRLFHDMGLDGDDAIELLHLYSKEFNVGLSHFHFSHYFGEEGALSPLRLVFRLFNTGNATEKKMPLTIRDLVNAVAIGDLK